MSARDVFLAIALACALAIIAVGRSAAAPGTARQKVQAMSGWFLFFLLLAVLCMPSEIKIRGISRGSAAVMAAMFVSWAAVVLGLTAAALRTGGHL